MTPKAAGSRLNGEHKGEQMTIWSFLHITNIATAPEEISSYEDHIGEFYSWDNTVANHARVRVNDIAIIVDEVAILGIGKISKLEIESSWKNRRSCPECKKTKISKRFELIPAYRCSNCKFEFDSPAIEVLEVISYRAHYGKTWERINNVPKNLLGSAYISKAVQQSIRELQPAKIPAIISLNL